MLLGFVTEMDVVAREVTATEMRVPPRSAHATRNTTIGGHTGWRAELTVASMLASAGLRYTWRDRPDFEVGLRDDTLAVEVTAVGLAAYQSAKPPSSQREQARMAVVRGVRGHRGKPYEGPDALLFVDVTMPMATEAIARAPGEPPIHHSVLHAVARTLGGSGYAAVVLHTYFIETRSVSLPVREPVIAAEGHVGVLLNRHGDEHVAAVRWFGSNVEHRLLHVTHVLENSHCTESVRELIGRAFLPASMDGRTLWGTVPPSNIY